MQKFSVAAVFVIEAEDLKAATTKLKDELGQVVGDMVFGVPEMLNDRLENYLDFLAEEAEYEAPDGDETTFVFDAGEVCLWCGNSVVWGEGRYVNRVPADRSTDDGTTVDGWMCAECEACDGECTEPCACCDEAFDFESFAAALRSDTFVVDFEDDGEDDPDIYGVTWFSSEGPVAETGYGFTRTFAEQVALEGVEAEDFEHWATNEVPWSMDLLCGEDEAITTPYPLVRAEISTQEDGKGTIVWQLEG